MEFEDINDTTIKITLSFDDLTEHDIKLSDFFGNQEVIEQFFYELVDELGLENRFGNVGMLTFQIQPFPKGVHMIVHEEALLGDNGEIPDDPEEFEKLMTGFYEKLNEVGAEMGRERGLENFKPGLALPGKEKVEQEPDFIYYTVRYDDVPAVLRGVKNVKFADEESEFYRYDGAFFLVILDNQKAKGKMHVESTRARMLEYGESAKLSREYLQEYGDILIEQKALDVLRKI
jgi:adapter protein MecA 1/2